MVPLECHQVFEWVDLVDLGCVDQAHVDVPDPSALCGLVEQAVLAMQDGPFQGTFADIVVQGGSRLPEEQGQCGPVLEHVADGLAQAGVRLHLLSLHLVLQPGFQVFHDRTAVLLVEPEPILGCQVLGLAVVMVDIPQTLQQMPAFLGEVLHHVHEPTASVGQAVSHQGFERAFGVGRQRITHLDRRREILVPDPKDLGQVLPGVVVAGAEQDDPPVSTLDPGPGHNAGGVDPLPLLSVEPEIRAVQELHRGVVVEHHVRLGRATNQLVHDRIQEAGGLLDQLPLGGGGQRDAEVRLQPCQAMEGGPSAVFQEGHHGCGRSVEFLRPGPLWSFSREYLATGVAAQPLALDHLSLEGGQAHDPDHDGRLGHGVDPAIGTLRALVPCFQALVGDLHPLSRGIAVRPGPTMARSGSLWLGLRSRRRGREQFLQDLGGRSEQQFHQPLDGSSLGFEFHGHKAEGGQAALDHSKVVLIGDNPSHPLDEGSDLLRGQLQNFRIHDTCRRLGLSGLRSVWFRASHSTSLPALGP